MRYKLSFQNALQQPYYLLYLVYILIAFSILLVSGFRGLYGQDSYAYLNYSRQFTLFFSHGQVPGEFQWPVIYPLLGSLLSFIFFSEHLALLLISIFSFGTLLVVCYRILSILYPSNQSSRSHFLILFFCFSPFWLRSSLCIMSENLAEAFCMLAFYSALFSASNFRLLYFVIWASLACCTRYAMGVLLFVPFLYLLYKTVRSKSYGVIIPALFCAACIVGTEIYFKSYHKTTFYNNNWLQTWSIVNFFESTFINQDGLQLFNWPNLVHVFSVMIHPGFIFCGVLFLFYSKFRNLSGENYVMLISVLIYLLFQAGLATQSQRFLLPVFPLLLIFYYPAFHKITGWKTFQTYRRLAFSLILLIQVLFFCRAFLPFVNREKMEKTIASYMKQLKPQQLLYTTGLEGALEVYGVKNPRKSLYHFEYSNFEKPSYILVNPPELEKQWKGTNPYRNWTRLNEHHSLVKIRELEGNWVVYELR